jgi:hypothetical protein
MKLLFTGNGTAGSWLCRGHQIGYALGATVDPLAGVKEFAAADVTVVVKRVNDERLAALRAAGRPWVLDVLDFYPQPEAASWSQREAIQWAQARLKKLSPTGVIWPNARMAEDVGFSGAQSVIYHHHRPGIRRNPIRRDVKLVGYEGAAPYIEKWRPHIEAECDKRGWQFVLNPPQLAELDIVLALRGGNWNGYVPEHWKSNVKLANAHGSGTPFIGSPECGYRETASGCEYWASDLGSLRTAFDWLTEQRARENVSDRFLQRAYSVDQAATAYRGFLCGPKFY